MNPHGLLERKAQAWGAAADAGSGTPRCCRRMLAGGYITRAKSGNWSCGQSRLRDIKLLETGRRGLYREMRTDFDDVVFLGLDQTRWRDITQYYTLATSNARCGG